MRCIHDHPSNAEPGAPAHRAFTESGLVDSWAAAHPECSVERPATFHNFVGSGFVVPHNWAAEAWAGSLGKGGVGGLWGQITDSVCQASLTCHMSSQFLLTTLEPPLKRCGCVSDSETHY